MCPFVRLFNIYLFDSSVLTHRQKTGIAASLTWKLHQLELLSVLPSYVTFIFTVFLSSWLLINTISLSKSCYKIICFARVLSKKEAPFKPCGLMLETGGAACSSPAPGETDILLLSSQSLKGGMPQCLELCLFSSMPPVVLYLLMSHTRSFSYPLLFLALCHGPSLSWYTSICSSKTPTHKGPFSASNNCLV